MNEIWTLTRFAYLPHGTLGKMTRPDAAKTIYTIERPWLHNIPYESCVPEGSYDLFPFSGRRHRDVIILNNVPSRSYCLFHIANKPTDVQGCIGPGFDWRIDNNGNPSVLTSRLALKEIMDDFNENIANKEIDGTRLEIHSARSILK